LPSLKLHRKYAELANLPIDICEAVDRFIDFGPKKIFGREFNIHDLGRQNSFLFLILSEDLCKRYGYDGVRCFILHHMLDHIEELYKLRYSREEILKRCHDKFLSLVIDLRENSYHDLQCLKTVIKDLGKCVTKVLDFVKENLDNIIEDISKDLERRKIEINNRRAIMARLIGVINTICSLTLIQRGYFSRGLRVKYDAFTKLQSAVIKEVNKRLTENEEFITEDILQEINSFLIRFKKSPLETLREEIKRNSKVGKILQMILKIAANKADQLGYYVKKMK